MTPLEPPLSGRQLEDHARTIAGGCVRCGRCLKECAFLERTGFPGDIAAGIAADRSDGLAVAFECSLCGLCTDVCPERLGMPAMFLEMRRVAETYGWSCAADRCTYIGYENRGTSPHLSVTALPVNCRTVFFPGCSFPACRPDETRRLFQLLAGQIPALGIMLDCCAKPSHDLGRQAHFDRLFGELRAVLVDNGVERILVNCPNCYKIFSHYGTPLEVETLYTYLDRRDLAPAVPTRSDITIHDPCVLRFEPEIQQAVRRLLSRSGYRLREMPHNRQRTLCCGNGASVSCTAPELSSEWTRRREAEQDGIPLTTYCAGCAGRLSAHHILDLVLDPIRPLKAARRPVRFPITCYNRAKLKRWFQRELTTGVQWTRSPTAVLPSRKRLFSRQNATYLISAVVSRLAR
jgi:Fe-S oxidoreductase